MKTILLALFILLLITLSGCTTLYFKAMGMKTPRVVTWQNMEEFKKEAQLNEYPTIQLDSVAYAALIQLKLKDTSAYKQPNWWVQNHVQPTQVVYYDKLTQRPVASFFNCIAESKGLNNLTWNKYQELDSFPPREYADWRWIDTLFTPNEIMHCFRYKSQQDSLFYTQSNKRYQIFLIYALFTKKQSLNLSREVRTHLDKFIPNDYDLYPLCYDNFFMHAYRQK
jgi:hypothetical protein